MRCTPVSVKLKSLVQTMAISVQEFTLLFLDRLIQALGFVGRQP